MAKHLAAAAAAEFDVQLAAETSPAQEVAPVAAQPPALSIVPSQSELAAQAPAAPSERVVDPDVEALRARYQQMEAERNLSRDAAFDATQRHEQAQEQLRAMQATLETSARENEEIRSRLRNMERESTYRVDYNELESLTPDVARELDEKLIRPRLTRIEDEYEQRLKQQRSDFERERDDLRKGQTDLNETQKNERLARINRGIERKHNDFQRLVNDQTFLTFLDQTIPGTRTKFGTEMRAAYYDGDIDYVTSVVDRFKQGGAAPALHQIADAGAVRVASTPAGGDLAGRTYTMREYEDMSFRFRNKTLSYDDWKKFSAQFKAAEAEGRVR
jgi:hypothetical protein